MILSRFAVCSETNRKPITRAVVETRAQAEGELERIRTQDGAEPEDSYWITELGPESEGWRWLAPFE